MTALGTRIQAARLNRNLTQAQVAAELGTHRVNVSKWESGEREPTVASLAGLVRAFRCDGHWLLTGETR